MNLEQFLNQLFPHRPYQPDALAEEGSRNSLLGHQDSHFLQDSQSLSDVVWSVWRRVKQLTGFRTDPYEVIRMLCIDIGHGLGSLHGHNFTHGDLKPANVLVFKKQERWIAKLCDFGCAVGKAEAIDKSHKAVIQPRVQYCGTPGWQPPEVERSQLHDFEGLRKCDLYVYALVVWSSFCLRGKPPGQVSLVVAREVVKELGKRIWRPFPEFVRGEPPLAEKLSSLLEGTMVHPSDRDHAPWRHLYLFGKAPRADTLESTPTPGQDTEHADSPSTDSGPLLNHLSEGMVNSWNGFQQCPLPPHIKAQYNDRPWWSRGRTSKPCEESAAQPTVDDLLNYSDAAEQSISIVGDTPSASPSEDVLGPASSEVIGLDDNSLSTTVFKSDKYQDDAHRLYPDMDRVLNTWVKSLYSAAELYHLARFRSRIKMGWWETTPVTSNILARALKAQPPVNIHTLAWLCKGPVGKYEVKSLPRDDHQTWGFVKSTCLNESEQLDRLLLLLQFGAPLWTRSLPRPSALAVYIQSCRLATVPTIVDQFATDWGILRMDFLHSLVFLK
jgi:serine/threonine protein kinase